MLIKQIINVWVILTLLMRSNNFSLFIETISCLCSIFFFVIVTAATLYSEMCVFYYPNSIMKETYGDYIVNDVRRSGAEY